MQDLLRMKLNQCIYDGIPHDPSLDSHHSVAASLLENFWEAFQTWNLDFWRELRNLESNLFRLAMIWSATTSLFVHKSHKSQTIHIYIVLFVPVLNINVSRKTIPILGYPGNLSHCWQITFMLLEHGAHRSLSSIDVEWQCPKIKI